MYDDAFWSEAVSGVHSQNRREDRVRLNIDEEIQQSVINASLRRMCANPVSVLERAIGHIGRKPNYPTGAAIQILSKLTTQILKEKHQAAQRQAQAAAS